MSLSIDRAPALRQVAEGVWVVDVGVGEFPLREVPLRMTLIASRGGVVVHSPVPLDDETWSAIVNDVGEVRHVIAPNEAHYLGLVPFFARCATVSWSPQLWLAPGLKKKLSKKKVASELPLSNAKTFADGESTPFPDDLEWVHLAGVPGLNEVVFFHRTSQTLIVTDAIVNVREHPAFVTRNIFKMIRAYGGEKQPFLWRLRANDKPALVDAVQRVLAWPFERVVCAHGDVLESGGRAAFKRVFGWAGEINEETST